MRTSNTRHVRTGSATARLDGCDPNGSLQRGRTALVRLGLALACICFCGLPAAADPVKAGAATDEQEQEQEQEDFYDRLERVTQALRTNATDAPQAALETCDNRRRFAATLYRQQYNERAERSLAYCFDVLGIPATAPRPPRPQGPDMQAIAARAGQEIERALGLEPNLEHGLEVYRDCALCHMPEGWGMQSGLVPQLAGQHRQVIIKQLADIRAGGRDAHLMLPYATVEAIGGAQSVADVSAYIDTLEITTDVGHGTGRDLERGQALYADQCAGCHGDQAEGDASTYTPRLQSQHFRYMQRQVKAIRDGKRKNGDPEMQKLVQALDEAQMNAVLDYVSRLQPPEELQAPKGWHNPDFAPPPAPLAGVRPD